MLTSLGICYGPLGIACLDEAAATAPASPSCLSESLGFGRLLHQGHQGSSQVDELWLQGKFAIGHSIDTLLGYGLSSKLGVQEMYKNSRQQNGVPHPLHRRPRLGSSGPAPCLGDGERNKPRGLASAAAVLIPKRHLLCGMIWGGTLCWILWGILCSCSEEEERRAGDWGGINNTKTKEEHKHKLTQRIAGTHSEIPCCRICLLLVLCFRKSMSWGLVVDGYCKLLLCFVALGLGLGFVFAFNLCVHVLVRRTSRQTGHCYCYSYHSDSSSCCYDCCCCYEHGTQYCCCCCC